MITKAIALWVVFMVPTRECAEARRPRELEVQVVGSTQTFRIKTNGPEEPRASAQFFADEPKITGESDCFDTWIARLDLQARQVTAAKIVPPAPPAAVTASAKASPQAPASK